MRLVEDLESFKKRLDNTYPVDAEVNWDVIDNCGIIDKFEELGFQFTAVKNLFTKKVPHYKMMVVKMDAPFIEVDGKKFTGTSSQGNPLISYSIFPDGEVYFTHNLSIKIHKVWFPTNKFKLWVDDQMTTEWVLRVLYTIYQHIFQLIDEIRITDAKIIDSDLTDAINELW